MPTHNITLYINQTCPAPMYLQAHSALIYGSLDLGMQIRGRCKPLMLATKYLVLLAAGPCWFMPYGGLLSQLRHTGVGPHVLCCKDIAWSTQIQRHRQSWDWCRVEIFPMSTTLHRYPPGLSVSIVTFLYWFPVSILSLFWACPGLDQPTR